MIDKVPPRFEIPTRNELVEAHKKFRRMRNPTIDTSDGGEPDIDARVTADSLLPQAAHARKIADCALVSTAYGDAIATWGAIHGVEPGLPAGATGFVRISASVGGTLIQEGDALYEKNQGTGPRYECSITSRYFNGGAVPIRAVDTGFVTNKPPGTVLVWAGNVPGLHPQCTVIEQEDGSGLSGGRPAASSAEHQQAILDKLRDPPGASNAAHYRFEAKRAGVAVAQAFSYSAIRGPGTIGIAFLVPPASPVETMSPQEDQMRIVGQHIESLFGADDGVLMMVVENELVTIAYKIKWRPSGVGWYDAQPWPEYVEAGSGAHVIDSVVSATEFGIRTDDDSYSGVPDPAVGSTIALYDATTGRFSRKRIGSIAGSGPWTITADTTNGASDEDYVPVEGQRVSPWSTNLDAISAVVIETFKGLGPGEIFSMPQADGYRRARVPNAPEEWPHSLTEELLESPINSANIPQVFDRQLMEGAGSSPSLGTLGVLVNRLRLGDLAIFNKV